MQVQIWFDHNYRTPLERVCLFAARTWVLSGVYAGPVVPPPPVDGRPVEDVEEEEEDWEDTEEDQVGAGEPVRSGDETVKITDVNTLSGELSI